MLNRRSFVGALVGVGVFLSSGFARADGGVESRAFIQKLAQNAMTTVAVKDLSDAERANRFRSLFVDAFDLPEIGKLVLARYWRAATPDQKKEFLSLFEDIQVYTWTRRFKEYSGETLDILGVSSEAEGDLQVDSQIKREKRSPINVSWRVRPAAGTFHVIDIKVEGASMALTHQSEYVSLIQRSGGNLDGLLAVMRDKVAALKAGG